MHFTLSPLLVGVLAATATATPIAADAKSVADFKPNVTSDIVAPSPDITGHLFVCTDSNFSGQCQNLQFTSLSCMTLFNQFISSVSSLGPDKGFTCTLWQNDDCTGPSLSGIVNPGIQDLRDFNFNDKANSYKCN